jgi:hypothetical protein
MVWLNFHFLSRPWSVAIVAQVRLIGWNASMIRGLRMQRARSIYSFAVLSPDSNNEASFYHNDVAQGAQQKLFVIVTLTMPCGDHEA